MKINKTWSCKGTCFGVHQVETCHCKDLTPTLNKKRKRIWVSLDCSKCGKSYTYEEVERRLKKTIEG